MSWRKVVLDAIRHPSSDSNTLADVLMQFGRHPPSFVVLCPPAEACQRGRCRLCSAQLLNRCCEQDHRHRKCGEEHLQGDDILFSVATQEHAVPIEGERKRCDRDDKDRCSCPPSAKPYGSPEDQ